MKKLPIGVNDFKELIEEGYYFADKSMLIRDVIELSGKIKLITRPRRFGKTLGMSMIDHFFSLFRGGELFEGLLIWKEKGIVKEYYHKYPVIFVTFKEVKDTNWEMALGHLKTVISNLVEEWAESIKDEKFKKWVERIRELKAPISEYMDSLRYLTRVLHKETGKKAILLIDEYDVPIEAAYTYRHKDPDYYDDMVAFMRNMLTAALKDNEHLEFGILTGVYRVAKESIFSGLNNLAVYTVFENKMTDKFGFTEDEVLELIKHYDLDGKEIETLREWYDGFRIGMRDHIYNPWSVLLYIDSRLSGLDVESSLQPYWINTSSNDLVRKQVINNPTLKETLEYLLEGKEILQVLDPWLSLRELDEVSEGVWTLLVSSGYLIASYYDSESYYIKIHNREVKKFFQRTVNRWLAKALNMHDLPNMYRALEGVLKEGKVEEFKKFIKTFIENSMSYHDFGYSEPERVYKAFLLGILSIAINGYMVESEKESGYGRLDVAVYPKEKKFGEYAAIFEVKKTEDEGKKLQELARKALMQIKDRRYYKKMVELGYEVIGFGIAFSSKKVEIEAQKIEDHS